MNKIFLIVKREYITRVKKKSFIITTLLVPLSFVAMVAIQFLLLAVSSGDTMRIAVVDDTGKYVKTIKDTEGTYFIKSNSSLASLRQTYEQKGFDGILYIPPLDVDNPNGVKYISDNLLGLSLEAHIKRELKSEIQKVRLQKMGVDSKMYRKAQQVNLRIESETITGGSVGSTALATSIGFGMGMLMYIVIFIYGSMVMKGVMEEKTNRIVEIMLSSVRPFQLMIGKILGIGGVGLTQFSIWIILLFGLNLIMSLVIGGTMDLPSANPAAAQVDMEEAKMLIEKMMGQIHELPIALLIVGFLFYFLMGYVLYAALFAGLGAAINDDSDSQSLTFPVSIPVIISVFILSAIVEQPNSGLAFWSSLIPLFSPVIMPFRIAFGVPLWELLLSMALLIAGALFAVWIAAKIYRTGILMYGKKVTLREIAKWLVRS